MRKTNKEKAREKAEIWKYRKRIVCLTFIIGFISTLPYTKGLLLKLLAEVVDILLSIDVGYKNN